MTDRMRVGLCRAGDLVQVDALETIGTKVLA
jgi:hypothetical protein